MLFITALLLAQALVYVSADCGCHNGGECNENDLTCTCPDGFYGPICNQYAETYKLVFEATPNVKFADIKDTLFKRLQLLQIQEFVEVGLRLGNVYKIRFYKSLTLNEREQVKSIANTASNVFIKELTDFNECETGQSCYDGLQCKNTLYSFKCDCPSGYQAKNFRCVQEISEDNKNTRTVIYVWAGAVAAVVLCMIGCLIFYRHRKIEKGRRLQREQEKKAGFRGVLSPTNLSEYDHGRRTSPSASVVDGRPYNMPLDSASLYSYNSPYGHPEPDYYRQQHRLSIPIDGLPNVGYEHDQVKYPIADGYGQPPYGQPPYGQPPYGQSSYGQEDNNSTYKAPLGSSPHDSNVQLAGTDEQEKS